MVDNGDMEKNANSKKKAKSKGKKKAAKSNWQIFLSSLKEKLRKYWREITILLLCFILGLLEIISFVKYQKANSAKNLDVAFYQMPQAMIDEIQKKVTTLYDGAITFTDRKSVV